MLSTIFSGASAKAWAGGILASLIPYLVSAVVAYIPDQPDFDERTWLTSLLVGLATYFGVYATPNKTT
jgi:hypothetical protein